MTAAFVLQHALDNIWCTPDHDRLVMVKPVKLTPPNGALRTFKVLWEVHNLPTAEYYHVYQIGQVPLISYNLPQINRNLNNDWTLLPSIITDKMMDMRVYSQHGLCYPLSQVYIKYTRDNNLIIAVRILKDFPLDLETTDIWLELYSNQFFNSVRWGELKTTLNKPNAVPVSYIYKHIMSSADVVAVRQSVIAALANSTITAERVIYTVNGRYKDDVSDIIDLVMGDYVEVLIDSSIKSVRRVPLSEMGSFTSLIEPEIKRLFPPTRTLNTIDYYDDIDFYLTNANGSWVKNGLFFNQNSPASIRMVTHNSYSLSNLQIGDMLANDAELGDESDVIVVALVRHAGYRRPLVLEHRRIAELYTLSDADIYDAMVGIDSTIPEWRAENLEASDYMGIISNWLPDITPSMVEDAYGYNLMTREFCNPFPVITGTTNRQVTKPIGIYRPSITSYDIDGHLLHTQSASNGAILPLPAPAADTRLVEFVPGSIVTPQDAYRWQGKPMVTVTRPLTETGYRCYCSPVVGGQVTEQWLDVTDELDNYFTVSTDGLTLQWDMALLDSLQYYPCLVVGDEVLWFTPDLGTTWPGYISFEINTQHWWSPVWPASELAAPILRTRADRIPFAVIDVFMEGCSLIEGVDYQIDYPTVVIYKKPTIDPALGLGIRVRGYGLAQSDLSRVLPREIGFVEEGLLSANNHRDLRNDRNVRIVVDGRVMRRNEVRFADDLQNYVTTTLNGRPYAVQDVVMPVEYFTDKDTMSYRDLSIDVDERVGDYLTQFAPGTPPPSINPILRKYDLFSPFCSTAIQLLKDGWLDGLLDDDYSNLDVENWISGFSGLLAYDPALDTTLDMRYIYIRPHVYNTTLELTEAQYRFVERLIRDYLTPLAYPTRVDLSYYVTIQDD